MDYSERLESMHWYSQEPEADPTQPLDGGAVGAAEWVEDEDNEPTF